MLKVFRSIYWRILSAFIFIIILTVLISTVIEYSSTKAELPHLLTEIRTKNLAQSLSSAYTRNNGWFLLKQEILNLENLEMINSSEKLSMRIIVRDLEGKTVYNSFADLLQRNNSPLIEGESLQILNYNNFQPVGTVTVYINKDFLDKETGDYILRILKPRIFQGLLTILIAAIIGAFISQRITAPISALTKATRIISQKGDSHFLPVNSSDELGQMSSSFNQMLESLQIQKELRKRLISDVSHDINTPLNVIRLEAKGLLDGLVSSDDAANQIIEEIDTLINLVYDLDWLAETDSGQFKLKQEQSSIEKLVESEVERWQFNAGVSRISLEFIPSPPGLPRIDVDVVRIGQAIGNLLDNGIKYVSPGGQITVKVYSEDLNILIVVSDNGPGIAKSDLPYLFERFYRVDRARLSKNGSRGLGLSIVKQIVELHNGKVRAESEEGRGSSFYISLPIPRF
jgi:two-component system sensor histidine kinase BaeS